MDPATPRVIGDFKILRELGRGGMGVVYLSRQLSLAREVALKLLSQEATADPQRILRFQREAALLGRMSHPNIVRVFLVGEDGPYHFLAMEYVEGTDLERVLRARQEGRESELPAEFRANFARAAARVVRDVAQGLGAAHAMGVIHRDVKPSNVLLGSDGRAVLADFGLARDLSVAALTRSQTALGTPYYMSPEQFRAEPPAPAADVYALGAVLYECATGRRPFEAATQEGLMAAILDHEPLPPRRLSPALPRDLETIVLKCLEKNPRLRYANGGELAADLARFLAGEPIEAVPAGSVTRVLRRMQRKRTPALFLILAALLAVAFLTYGYVQYSIRSFERVAREKESAARAITDALDADDLALARRLLDAELGLRPERLELRFERADLALRERRWEDAAADFEVIAAAGEEQVAGAIGLQLVRGILAQPRGREVEPPPAAPARTAREHYYKSVIHQARAEWDLALIETECALEADPDLLEAWYSLGGVRRRLGDYAGADDAFQRYAERRHRVDVFNLIGRISIKLKKYDVALRNFELYARARENDVIAWNNLAETHFCLAMEYAANNNVPGWKEQCEAERENGRKALERARALDPEFEYVLFNTAVLAVLDERFDAAEEEFAAAIQRAGSDRERAPEMWLFFARTLDFAGRSERAVQYLEAAREHFPAFAAEFAYVFAYAEALDRAGDKRRALAVLDQALGGQLSGSKELSEQRQRIAGRQE